MKTTIELADSLLREARRSARERGLTLKALIEEGLRLVLRDHQKPGRFQLKRKSFRGTGRAAGTESWESVRELIYREQGG
jgi:hypothetical protein